jgi:hypothetical protein
MIELTASQQQAINEHGPQPLRVLDPTTRQEYVLLRADLFDRLKHLLLEESDLSSREVAFLIDRAMQEYDADDPSLDLYQQD